MKYTNCVLRKGNRVIQVLIYKAPSKEAHKSPSGTRRGYYACDVNGKTRYIMTHNISRYYRKMGFLLESPDVSYLHAQYASKTQENVTTRETGFWNKLFKLIGNYRHHNN